MGYFLFDNLIVSRETIKHLERYEALVRKWSKSINLISQGTRDGIWDRHILDSAQLYINLPPKCNVWIDLGSGAGFPGLVISILAKQNHPCLHVYLIESDKRKSVFLRNVIQELSLQATVVNERIENVNLPFADIVSARALTSLVGLLDYAYPHLRANGTCLFQKGVNWKKEVVEAENNWSFDLQVINSKTQTGAVTLHLGDIRRG